MALASMFCIGWFVPKSIIDVEVSFFYKTTKNQIQLITLITITGRRGIISADQHLLNQLC